MESLGKKRISEMNQMITMKLNGHGNHAQDSGGSSHFLYHKLKEAYHKLKEAYAHGSVALDGQNGGRIEFFNY